MPHHPNACRSLIDILSDYYLACSRMVRKHRVCGNVRFGQLHGAEKHVAETWLNPNTQTDDAVVKLVKEPHIILSTSILFNKLVTQDIETV